MSRPLQTLLARAIALVLLLGTLTCSIAPAVAGPVDWREVPASSDGRQWWDAGSLRLSPNGRLTVLSRYQPTDDEEGRPRPGELYVMELDCGQKLYRDKSVNGLPRFRAEWQPASGDDLISAVIDASCEASATLNQAA